MRKAMPALVLGASMPWLLGVATLLFAQTPGGYNWHDSVFFGIHYDLHANAQDTELGRELTPDLLRERLRLIRPDWIQTDCKGHPGYTSWPTKVGSTSPGVVKDSLRIYRDVTRELGIKLGMHYSGVWDSRAVELHPEWARIDERGQPDKNLTCRLSSYAEQLMIPQMMELIDRYDVDGFWVDGENWASQPCWCERCQTEFTRRTGMKKIPYAQGQPYWQEWLDFHRELFVEHVTKYTNAVHARKPGCLVVSNWAYTYRQPEPIKVPLDYLSGDFSPAWGADTAALEGRVMDSRGLSWDLMAWGFAKTHGWLGDPPWTFKSALHLQQEISEAIALGGAVMVYENPQRSGWLTGWHHQILSEVASFCRVRQQVCFKSKTVPEAAVLHLASHHYADADRLYPDPESQRPVQGALQALLETHHSTDILTEESALKRMQEYKLVVVPEQTRLTKAMIQALEAYAQAGGQVLISGDFLSRDYPALVGSAPRGKEIQGAYDLLLPAATFLPLGDFAVPVSSPWQPVTPAVGTEVLVYRLKQQEPTKDKTDEAVITRRRVGGGSITAVHGPLFNDYFRAHYPLLRKFIGQLLDHLGIPWTVQVEASPRLEMVLRRKDQRILVNLINRGAGEMLSANRMMIEELPPVENVTLEIRLDRKPRSISVVPGDLKINWSYQKGLAVVRVPRVEIHRVIVVD